jgi:hypothetical protein
MKIIIILFLILFLTASNNKVEVEKGTLEKKMEYIESVMAPYNVPHKNRIRDCILIYSYKYDIPVEIMTRLPETESSFKYYRINPYSKCIGLFQVSQYYWSWYAWSHKKGKYAKLLNKHKGTNITKVMKFIELNTDMGGYILSTYYKQYGSYEEALQAYGGFKGKYSYRTNLMTTYLQKILQDI